MGVSGGRKRGGLWVVVLWLGILLSAQAAAAAPNFVILLTDDQRWDAVGVVQAELGAAGRLPWLVGATPNIDRLAAEGFRFRNAFVVSALCSPSRAALLTGRYNHLNGVANNHTPFPTGNPTFATAMRAKGYRTGYFGKWHMGNQTARPGFDEYASFLGQGRYDNADFLVNGTTVRTVGWVDDISTNYAVDFIRRNATKPFAMVLGFKSPHIPWDPPQRLEGLFPGVEARPTGSATSYAPYDPTPVPPVSLASDVQNYARTIVGVDENVGRVMSALRAARVDANTVVVFMSDNGLFIDEHGVPIVPGPAGNKRAAYQESIRVPLLIRYPALGRSPAVLDAVALNIDLAPTLLELASVPRRRDIQGISLVPVLTGTAKSVRSRFLYEYFYETGFYVPNLVALQRGRYKLIRYLSNPSWTELFDLTRDPLEITNLATSPAAASTLSSMSKALDDALRGKKFKIPTYADPEP